MSHAIFRRNITLLSDMLTLEDRQDFMAVTGLNQGDMVDFLTGGRIPPPRRVRQIADYFGVTPHLFQQDIPDADHLHAKTVLARRRKQRRLVAAMSPTPMTPLPMRQSFYIAGLDRISAEHEPSMALFDFDARSAQQIRAHGVAPAPGSSLVVGPNTALLDARTYRRCASITSLLAQRAYASIRPQQAAVIADHLHAGCTDAKFVIRDGHVVFTAMSTTLGERVSTFALGAMQEPPAQER